MAKQYFKEDKFQNNDSTDEEEDLDMPSSAECLNRCREFASITSTDNALAMFYLQDTKWDLQKSLDAYYKATDNKTSKVVACFDLKQLDEDEERSSRPKKRNSSEQENFDKIVTIEQNDSKKMQKGNYFKILSWNIDGLDSSAKEQRTIGVANKINKEEPDVIMLQEVVKSTESILRSHLVSKYEFFSGESHNEYYTMILLRKKTCTSSYNNIIEFENSVMGRNLLQVKLNYMKQVDICVMTSHLESTAEFAKQRIEQLRKCIKEAQNQDENYLVFFGGDLNMRDAEVTAIGGLPKGFSDLWEATGARNEAKFTWDLTRNTNLTWNQKFKPRCRFDRMFFRENRNSNQEFTLMPVYFELEGLEKLKTCNRFCSDHWAIQVYCQIEKM